MRKYKNTIDEIIRNLIYGDLLCIDETNVKVKGFSSPYVWVFTNMDSVLYLLRQNREAEFLKDFLKEFKGVLVSDYYSGYDSLPCPQQKCLVHLIRDLNEDLFKNQFDSEFKIIVDAFGKLLRKIIGTIDKYGLKKRHLNKHSLDVRRFYKKIISIEYKTEISIAYQKRFMKNKDKLFTFLNYDGIPWNNNNAEHAIKSFAYHRSHIKGNFTEKSIKDHLLLLSMQQTCKYRGINFLDFLRSQEISINKYSKMS